MTVLIAILVATLCTQVPSLLGIRYFAVHSNWEGAFWIALVTLPFSFSSTVFYIFYYGRGHHFFSYPTLTVISTVMSLIFAISVQVMILKNRDLHPIEQIGLGIIIVGLVITLYKSEIAELYKHLQSMKS